MAKTPDMVMMNYNAAYEDAADLTDMMSYSYVLIKKLETIEIDNDTKRCIEEIKKIMRKRGSKI